MECVRPGDGAIKVRYRQIYGGHAAVDWAVSFQRTGSRLKEGKQFSGMAGRRGRDLRARERDVQALPPVSGQANGSAHFFVFVVPWSDSVLKHCAECAGGLAGRQGGQPSVAGARKR